MTYQEYHNEQRQYLVIDKEDGTILRRVWKANVDAGIIKMADIQYWAARLGYPTYIELR